MANTNSSEDNKEMEKIENFKNNFLYELSKNYYFHKKQLAFSFGTAMDLELRRIEKVKENYRKERLMEIADEKINIEVSGIPEYAYFLAVNYLNLIKEIRKFSGGIKVPSKFFDLEERAIEALKDISEENYDKKT